MANRLIERIEKQWEAIAAEVINQLRKDQEAGFYHTLSEEDVRERALDLVRNLGRWLDSGSDAELHLKYEKLGAKRRREGVPLPDVLYKIFLVKRKIRSYAMLSNLEMSAAALYEELELLRRMGQCFDMIACHIARGYCAEESEEERKTAA
ncbi:MAG: hypothetical protein U5J83_05260 [Bryobacterales bacterium]|nr:hypothetical protein [Bryobacterales bacterium]